MVPLLGTRRTLPSAMICPLAERRRTTSTVMPSITLPLGMAKPKSWHLR
ncbi:MAG TPA: hypothetical protein VNO26_10530 [Candidatus Limnocylindria bacterium]|nr:hypothetical protein [Candidatus Limnocylindria bacterium]